MGGLRRRLLPLLAVGLGFLAACSRQSPNALEPEGPAAKSLPGVRWLMFGLVTAV